MKKHSAFTLLEVIFVLVILGIVASIGSSIIIQVYENYITQKAVYTISTKTELAVTQMVNRLSHRIQETTISKDHTKYLAFYNGTGTVDTNDSIDIDDIPQTGSKYTTIEWIGYDNDSYDANASPSWSGIGNYETATHTSFDSPGSDLSTTATIMNNLSNGKVDLTNAHPAAVLFYQQDNYYQTSKEYDYSCMGLIPNSIGGTTECIFPVQQNGNHAFTFTTDRTKIITERYKLAWSAYTLAPEPNTEGQFDLVLYSNYQPWNDENYIQNGNRKILVKNISVFKFSERAGVLQFKLCATEKISNEMNISSCKEKVVIR